MPCLRIVRTRTHVHRRISFIKSAAARGSYLLITPAAAATARSSVRVRVPFANSICSRCRLADRVYHHTPEKVECQSVGPSHDRVRIAAMRDVRRAIRRRHRPSALSDTHTQKGVYSSELLPFIQTHCYLCGSCVHFY